MTAPPRNPAKIHRFRIPIRPQWLVLEQDVRFKKYWALCRAPVKAIVKGIKGSGEGSSRSLFQAFQLGFGLSDIDFAFAPGIV